MERKVLVTENVHEAIIPLLTDAGYQVVVKNGIRRVELLQEIKTYSGIIISTRTKVDRVLIDAAVQLQFVGRVGSGMEHVDIAYCQQKGIQCYSSPEGNAPAVGEHCLGMLLSLVRNMRRSQQELSHGVWKRQENTGIELEGRTIGIIGYGHTGPAFVKKLQGFNMQVLVFDPYKKIADMSVRQVSLETLQSTAEIISFHVPFNKETHHYLNSAFIENCPLQPIFINTSRGAIMDTIAVRDGLISGKIGGLCVDVYEDEPINQNHHYAQEIYTSIFNLDNVIATSHIAGWTWEAKERMVRILAGKILNSQGL